MLTHSPRLWLFFFFPKRIICQCSGLLSFETWFRSFLVFLLSPPLPPPPIQMERERERGKWLAEEEARAEEERQQQEREAEEVRVNGCCNEAGGRGRCIKGGGSSGRHLG